MQGKIEKYELCASCLKIPEVEVSLDSEGYKRNIMARKFLNMGILERLKKNGGCPACINLFERALNEL